MWENVDSTDLCQGRNKFPAFVKAVMDLWVQKGGGDFLNSWETVAWFLSKKEQISCFCERSNEPLGSIKLGGGGISWTAGKPSASQEGLCCMEFVIASSRTLKCIICHTARVIRFSLFFPLKGVTGSWSRFSARYHSFAARLDKWKLAEISATLHPSYLQRHNRFIMLDDAR